VAHGDPVGLRRCHSPWHSENFESNAISSTEQDLKKWNRELQFHLEQFANEFQGEGLQLRTDKDLWHPAYFGKLFTVALPPSGPACTHMGLLGEQGDHDEAKRFCGTKSSMVTSGECVIVSIGSNNQWQFEVLAFQSLPCRIVTFDCTSQDSMPEFIRPRTTFYKICVGIQDEIRAGRQSMTWESLLMHAGIHSHPFILKLDVEGYEYGVIPAILAAPDTKKPMQILMELHAQTIPTFSKKAGRMGSGISWQDRRKTPGEVVAFVRDLHDNGYRFTYIDHETTCRHCREVVVTKVFCDV
jgi:hypothetical protein